MILPFMLLGGVALFSYYSGRGACYAKALKACQAQNAHALFDVAESFNRKGDTMTGAMLNELGMRMQTANSGGVLGAVPTYDPDNTGNPALEELGARLWNLETRIAVLKGWSAAYLRSKLPVMAAQLSVKAAQLTNHYQLKA